MAICAVQAVPEGDQAMYEKICGEVGIAEPNPDWPDGLLSHIAGPVEGGGWCVVTKWESQDQLERFRNDRLIPALERTGYSFQRPTIFQVFRAYHAEKEEPELRR